MIALAQFKARISLAIYTYKHDARRPPFNKVEMAAMALLLSGKESMTKYEISRWILARFSFYKDDGVLDDERIIKHSAKELNCSCSQKSSSSSLLRAYEVPVEIRDIGGYTEVYSISESNAHHVLGHIIGEDQFVFAGMFPIFRLPPELRNAIYEMVFQYPISGLRPCWEATHGGNIDSFATATRSLTEAAFDSETWRPASRFFTRSLHDILKPLGVGGQFSHEATPLFFSLNHFCLDSLEDLACFVDSVAAYDPSCVKHITHLSLTIEPIQHWSESFERIPEMFLALKGLKKLHVRLDERKWIKPFDGAVWRERGHSTAIIPALYTLRFIRGLTELTFTDCPRVEAMFRAGMMKPRRSLMTGTSCAVRNKRKAPAEGVERDLRLNKLTKRRKR